MKEFPDFFIPNNEQKLTEVNRNRLKCYLRRDIFEHVISHTETDYFSLDDFNNKRTQNMDLAKDLLSEVLVEIKEKGWKCQLSFGGSGLFVYAKDKPKNCWESEL